MIKKMKVSSVSKENFSGDVFNMELKSMSKEDDLFWCDATTGIFTHNCFPKDLNALIFVAQQMGVEPTVMKAVWEKNLEVVPSEHRDWEKMVGRAVSRKPVK